MAAQSAEHPAFPAPEAVDDHRDHGLGDLFHEPGPDHDDPAGSNGNNGTDRHDHHGRAEDGGAGSPTAGKHPNRRRGILIGAAVLAAIVVVALVISLTHSSGRSGANRSNATSPAVGGQSTSAGASATSSGNSASGSASGSASNSDVIPVAAQKAALVRWVEANVSKQATVVADADTVTQLASAGFGSATADTALAGVDWQTVDYLVSIPGSSTASATRNQLQAAAQPVAVFSGGDQAATVAQVFAKGSSGLAERRIDDADRRRRGGVELASNANVRTDDVTGPLLRSGQIDLRALNVLNVLASNGPVWLTAASIDPAEKRANLPMRSIVITVSDPQQAQNVLASMIAPFKPDSVVVVSQAKLQLTWPPAIAPVVTQGG